MGLYATMRADFTIKASMYTMIRPLIRTAWRSACRTRRKCGALLEVGLFTVFLLGSCLAAPSNRVKVVAVADACVTNGFVMARSTNADALSAIGYLPLVVPRIADTNLLAAAMDRADALLLTGAVKGQFQRNEFEHLLMRMAIERGMPIVGFCHGCQCINRYFGGKNGSTPKDGSPKVVHRGKEPPDVKDCFHMIDIVPGTRLAEGFGETRVEVNSSHRYCVEKLGDGLVVTARSDDGVVEAIEHKTLPITGFQFHPERMFRRDPRCLRIIVDALERGKDK